MENKSHLGQVRLWLGHITLHHIHAKFEEYLLNTLSVISKTHFEHMGCYMKTINGLAKKTCQDTVAIDTDYTKRCNFFVGNF